MDFQNVTEVVIEFENGLCQRVKVCIDFVDKPGSLDRDSLENLNSLGAYKVTHQAPQQVTVKMLIVNCYMLIVGEHREGNMYHTFTL